VETPAARIQSEPDRSESARGTDGGSAREGLPLEPIARVLALQRVIGNAAVARLAVQRRPAPAAAPARRAIARTPQEDAEKLLKAFAAKFPDGAKYIKGKAGAEKLILEAATAKVKFGGFSEDGPAKLAWPYTVGDTVYVPKARTDAIIAVSDFLFELNNAIREPDFAANTKAAAEKKIDAKAFARRKIELEVEGMLRMGKIWDEIKAGDKKLDKYDRDFFYEQYKAVKEGKKTAADIRDEVLQWKSGGDRSKTNEQYYMEQYPK
jgi:hypothetical protein